MTTTQQTLSLGVPLPPARLGRGRGRLLSPKQYLVIETLREQGTLSLEQAVALIGHGVYANRKHWVGLVLANMVRRGLIVRVKRGVFGL